MAKQFINELKSGQPVDSAFLLREKELKTTRGGKTFMTMDLCDRTGSIRANLWDATEKAFEAVNSDDFLQVKGRVETYQNNLQINVKTFERMEQDDVELGEFLAQTDKDVTKMLNYVHKVLGTIEEEPLAQLIKAFLDDTDFMTEFKQAPAATGNHHAYLGGLLEHTASMLRFAEKVCECYPVLRRDLLLAGVFLHDIGKIREFSYDLSLQYTDIGGLIGHLIIGCSMIEEKARGLKDFPEETLVLIEHLVLSHHGEYEYGSPKLPMIAEAIALHYIDNMDAKLNAVPRMIDEDSDEDSNWTAWQHMFQRRMYKR